MARRAAGFTATGTVPGDVTASAMLGAVAASALRFTDACSRVHRCTQKSTAVVPSDATDSRRNAVGTAHRGTGCPATRAASMRAASNAATAWRAVICGVLTLAMCAVGQFVGAEGPSQSIGIVGRASVSIRSTDTGPCPSQVGSGHVEVSPIGSSPTRAHALNANRLQRSMSPDHCGPDRLRCSFGSLTWATKPQWVNPEARFDYA